MVSQVKLHAGVSQHSRCFEHSMKKINRSVYNFIFSGHYYYQQHSSCTTNVESQTAVYYYQCCIK